MEEAVKNCAKNKEKFDLAKLRKQHARIQEILGNIQYLIDMIKEIDIFEEDQANSTLNFVQNVYNFAARTNYITQPQSEALKKVRGRYVERKKNGLVLKGNIKKDVRYHTKLVESDNAFNATDALLHGRVKNTCNT